MTFLDYAPDYFILLDSSTDIFYSAQHLDDCQNFIKNKGKGSSEYLLSILDFMKDRINASFITITEYGVGLNDRIARHMKTVSPKKVISAMEKTSEDCLKTLEGRDELTDLLCGPYRTRLN